MPTATAQPSATPFEPPVDPATLTLSAPVISAGTAQSGPALTVIPPVPVTQSTSDSPAPAETLTVTLADNGKTITLSVGQEFLLFLDQNGMQWTVDIEDQNVVSRVMGVMTINGSQGLFKANQSGQTSLSAVGDLPCRQSVPPCMAPSMLFQIQIIVQ
jgi:hypothetical protein